MGAKGDLMRGAILRGAMDLVTQDGVDGLTMSAVAYRVGCAVGALYRYFPTKQDLVVALEKQALVDYARFFEYELHLYSGGKGPARDLSLVFAAARAYFQHAEREPNAHRMLDLFLSSFETMLDEAQARSVEETLAPILLRCDKIFAEAAAHGAISAGDVRLRTLALWQIVHGTDHFRKRDRLLPPGQRALPVAGAAIEAMLLGWGADPAHLPKARKLGGL
jgi:AcrR family transcriptional regulator